jgi:non-homologous end joining protein Ku
MGKKMIRSINYPPLIMSRQTNFTLKFKAGLELDVSLAKSFGEKIGCVQTKMHNGKNKQVRTVKVVPKEQDGEPIKPVKVDDIDEVIGWTDVESSYRFKDEEGKERLLPMDKKAIDAIFTKGKPMTVVGFVEPDRITPNMYSGDHYFFSVKVDSKTKKPAESDVKAYSLMYYILSERNHVILTKFVSGDREKFAVIYCVGDGLMLSILIHHNYQRPAPQVKRVPLPKAEDHATKMLKIFKILRFDYATLVDRYEEQVRAYIESLKETAITGKVRVQACIKKPVQADDDFLGLLDAI